MKNFLSLIAISSLVVTSYGASKKVEKDVWVTIDESKRTKALVQLKKNFFIDVGSYSPLFTSKQGITVIKLNHREIDYLSGATHMLKEFSCPGFIAHDSYKEALEAAEFDYKAAEKAVYVTYKESSSETAKKTKELIAAVDQKAVVGMVRILEDMDTRHVGQQKAKDNGVSKVIKAFWQNIVKGRSDITIEDKPYKTGDSRGQHSVIMEIKGTESPDEIIVLGGHLDSVNNRGSQRTAPGADDDASGIGSMTGIIKAIVDTNFRPKKSIHFMGYSAEEVGLRGSQVIAKAYRNSRKKVVGVLQLDMTGYNENAAPNIITDYTNGSQNRMIKSLHDKYKNEIDFKGKRLDSSPCGYGCSDHASWDREKFPASFVFESTIKTLNDKYHSRNDKLSNPKMSPNKMTSFGKLGAAFIVKLSEDAQLVK